MCLTKMQRVLARVPQGPCKSAEGAGKGAAGRSSISSGNVIQQLFNSYSYIYQPNFQNTSSPKTQKKLCLKQSRLLDTAVRLHVFQDLVNSIEQKL